MPTSKIGLHDLDPSLFETLSNISGSNSQTKIFPLQVVASEDNQTIFPIGLGTFDAETDFAFVQSGVTNLFYGADFTIENKNIILNEGVPAGRTLGIYVLKNVAPLDEEDYVTGANLAPSSVTPDKIGGVLPIEKGGTGAITAEEVLTNLAGAKASDLTEHTGNKDNPHEVTAEQVGAVPKSIFYTDKDLNELVADGHYFVAGTLTDTNEYHLPDEYYNIMSAYGTGKYFEFQLITFAIGTRCCQIGVTPYNGELNSFGRMWYRIGTGSGTISSWTDWKEIFTTEGGVLKNNLSVANGRGEVLAWDNGAAIDAVVGEKRKRLQIIHEENDYTYVGIASINGNQVESVHQLYGEHNIISGTTDIGAGSALAHGNIYLVYE